MTESESCTVNVYNCKCSDTRKHNFYWLSNACCIRFSKPSTLRSSSAFRTEYNWKQCPVLMSSQSHSLDRKCLFFFSVQAQLMLWFFPSSSLVFPWHSPSWITLNEGEEAKSPWILGSRVPEWTAGRWGVCCRSALEQWHHLSTPPSPLRHRGWTTVAVEVRQKMVPFARSSYGHEFWLGLCRDSRGWN